MAEFLVLRSADEARRLLAAFPAVGAERVALAEADGRVLAADVVGTEALPAWTRAVMDGYAVRAADTFGASDTVPAFLSCVGAVPMGGVFPRALAPGEAAAIATGGVIPDGADAVVMIEFTDERAGAVAVHRGVATGDHVLRTGEDVARGAVLGRAGRRLRPEDVALCAALGITEVLVHRRPRVGVLSTGDELVAPDAMPRPGQVRDANQLALAAACRRCGCDVELGGVAADDAAELAARTRSLAASCDAVLLSGGSSVGARDLTAGALVAAGGEIIFHGISVRPGKPTILARAGAKPLLGMPGVPVSALVIFEVFVRPMLLALGGEREREAWPARRRARLSRRVPSLAGREDYVRVRLVTTGEVALAEPLLGGSSAMSTLARADGLVIVPAGVEGIAEGDEVEVLLHG